MRVLIVDDDPIALELLQDTLSDSGHEVRTARDGNEALSVLSGADCEVVICDWEMPHLDGIGLCRAIRADASASYVYVILLTGHNTTQQRVIGLSAGADDFIAKPFEPNEL